MRNSPEESGIVGIFWRMIRTKRKLASRHFVKDHTEAVNICPVIHTGGIEKLLWGHIGRRSEHRPCRVIFGPTGEPMGVRSIWLPNFCEAEIGDLQHPVIEHEVCGLQIPMRDNALAVGVAHSKAKFSRPPDLIFQGNLSGTKPLFERAESVVVRFDILRSDVKVAVDFVYPKAPHDIRMGAQMHPSFSFLEESRFIVPKLTELIGFQDERFVETAIFD